MFLTCFSSKNNTKFLIMVCMWLRNWPENGNPESLVSAKKKNRKLASERQKSGWTLAESAPTFHWCTCLWHRCFIVLFYDLVFIDHIWTEMVDTLFLPFTSLHRLLDAKPSFLQHLQAVMAVFARCFWLIALLVFFCDLI